MATRQSRKYRAYLLRCWQESGEISTTVWRFSLEDPRTGRRRGFASLEALVIALHQELSGDGKENVHKTEQNN